MVGRRDDLRHVNDIRRWIKLFATGAAGGRTTYADLINCIPFLGNTSFGLGITCSAGWYGYTGALPGYNTADYYSPSTGLTIVALINYQAEQPIEGVASVMVRDIARIVTPEPRSIRLHAEPTANDAGPINPTGNPMGRHETTASTRVKIVTLYIVLVSANVLVWALAFVFFSKPHALLLGTALLAFTFGLRHAVDADHISAIDNVTRKLMQDGKRPVGVGFYFSLGHSTIVFLLTVAIAFGASAVRSRLPALEAAGGTVGTSISAAFLLLIAAINALVLADLLRALRRVRAGERYCEQSVNDILNGRGLLGRFFKPLLRLVSRSRDMYLVGFLFGLGFDTATEVGVLGIAAIEAGKGVPIWTILLLPALFAAGMSLVDTTDGILMLGAYGWAFLDPARKLYYNVAITAASVLTAVVVGGIELSSLAGGAVGIGWLGYAVVATFALGWVASMAFYALRRSRDRKISTSG